MASFQVQKPLILMALPQESQGLFETSGLKVFYTGVGKIKSTFEAQKLIQQQRPEWVLNLGTAGSHNLPSHQLVECVRFIQRDPLFVQFPQKILEVNKFTNLSQTTCGTADFIESNKKAKMQIPCDVLDMEAYALAYVCEQMQVRFNSIKYITDASDQNVITDWQKNLKAASTALFEFFQNHFAD